MEDKVFDAVNNLTVEDFWWIANYY
jgi:hypothetical protein